MDVNTVVGILFVVTMGIFLYMHRSKLSVHKILGPIIYFAMYRGGWGLNAMDRLAKMFPRFMRWLFYFGIVVGFIGMFAMSWFLVDSTIKIFTQPGGMPGIQPVLPVSAPGVFFVPFAYWILSIFVVAVIHEFAHGVASRAHNIPVKSSGFAFLGIIIPIVPAAFVEPDEKKIVKRPLSQQLSVFAAGPLANVLMALALIVLLGFGVPGLSPEMGKKFAIIDMPGVVNGMFDNVLVINAVEEDMPAYSAGIRQGMVISAIDGLSVTDSELQEVLVAKKPGDELSVVIDGAPKTITLVASKTEPSRGVLGVQLSQERIPNPSAVAKYGHAGVTITLWIFELIVFVWLLSLGIGLFNLLPMGPLDGGRMFQLATVKMFGDKNGHKVWKYVGVALFAMMVFNLAAGFF